MSDSIGPAALEGMQERVQQIICEAKRQGASACEVSVSLAQGLSTSVRQGEVETVEFNRDQGFAITLYSGQQKGSASTTSGADEAIEETVAAALAIARHASADPFAGLADAELMATAFPDLDLYHPWLLTPEQAIEQALACEAAALAVDPRVTKGEGSSLNTHLGCRAYGNSHGFIGTSCGSRHSLSCSMIAEDGGGMQRDYFYDLNRVPEALASPAAIGEEAARRAVRRLGARSIPTAEVPVLFAPEIAVGLFGHLLTAISGGSLYRKASFLEGALGEQIFPEWMQVEERPYLPRALASTPYDGDGLATRQQAFVEAGRLRSYVLSTYSGRKLGLPSTANAGGVHNLFVSHGKDDQQSLIRQMGRGLLVTELMGQGVNLVTGDYSRGAGGFWVEGGEIQFPVQEVTIAGNLRDMFRQILAVGADVETRSSLHSGSVLIERMMVGGR